MKGKIVEWNDSKGYGFISAFNGTLKVFFHISSLQNKGRRPQLDDDVVFDVEQDDKGRYKAKQVSLNGSDPTPATVYFAVGYLMLAAIAILILGAEKLLISAYILMSIITYYMYAVDKKAAQNGKWRTPESSLHMASLLFGWPGALCAQSWLRHKSQKQSFKIELWLTIVLNIAAFAWMLSPEGQQTIGQYTAVVYEFFNL